MPIKNKEETYKANTEMSQNSDYIIGNLLDYEYFLKHHRLIAIDLSKQIELESPDLKQQINFIGKFEYDRATMVFIIKNQKKQLLSFYKIL